MEKNELMRSMRLQEQQEINGGGIWTWLLTGLAYDIISNWDESVESFNKGYLEGFNHEK